MITNSERNNDFCCLKDDWYSLLIADFQSDRELLVYCMFGVDDWNMSKDATKTTTINGVDVQITRYENSLVYKYRYYAIFEYDDIVYDIHVKSNDSDYIYDVLNQLLKKRRKGQIIQQILMIH